MNNKVAVTVYVKQWNTELLEWNHMKLSVRKFAQNGLFLYRGYDFRRREHILMSIRCFSWVSGDYEPLYKANIKHLSDLLEKQGITLYK